MPAEAARTTLIVSDLHVGGGAQDPGDDHVYDRDQLVGFIRQQLASPEGQQGSLELFFNGDFLEFAQTNVDAFSHVSDERWCTELESLAKLETIIAGHPDIFAALLDFQSRKNLVTIAAGNHDVDLYWSKVQARLCEVAGRELRFEIGKEWVERYDGKLQIGHGHMSDVANRFQHWDRPVVGGPYGVECLEMCPGTLFMVKFVNKLEKKYPFADNLLPVTRLAWVLLSDDKSGFASVGWMFTRLIATTSWAVLETGAHDDVGARLLAQVQGSRKRAARLDAVLAAQGMDEERRRLQSRSLDEDRLAALMFALLDRIDDSEWQALFALDAGAVSLGNDEITLSALRKAGAIDGKEELRTVAAKRARLKNASVIVMGHTHQQDEVDLEGGAKYLNPGCWTRYLELAPGRRVTLEDLKDESKYPYSLNVVRVEAKGEAVTARMDCIDRCPASGND